MPVRPAGILGAGLQGPPYLTFPHMRRDGMGVPVGRRQVAPPAIFPAKRKKKKKKKKVALLFSGNAVVTVSAAWVLWADVYAKAISSALPAKTPRFG